MIWEYFIIQLPEDDESAMENLNMLGMEAWNLVSVNTMTPVDRGELSPYRYVQYTFKRERRCDHDDNTSKKVRSTRA